MINSQQNNPISPLVCCFHPGKIAEWRCSSCNNIYCNDCVVHKKIGKFVAHICPKPECKGRCMPLAEDQENSNESDRAESRDQKKSLIAAYRKKPKHYLSRFYLSLFMPGLALILYDILLVLQGRNPSIWLILGWAALIFLMSGRYFWSFFCVATISAFHVIYCFYRIYSHDILFKNDSNLLNGISLGLWLLTTLILIFSYQEFTE